MLQKDPLNENLGDVSINFKSFLCNSNGQLELEITDLVQFT